LLPFPRGWFRVGASADFRYGTVQPLHYFGVDLVAFRTRDGKLHVLDAHCPHLGAHLGHGGRMKGDTVECPLHGWQWNGEGRCEAIPYSDRIPLNAPLRTWPVQEVAGQVLVF